MKLSNETDELQRVICNIRISGDPNRHENVDFRLIITKTSNVHPLSVGTAHKGYDSEDNHLLVREVLHALSIFPARFEQVPIWITYGR